MSLARIEKRLAALEREKAAQREQLPPDLVDAKFPRQRALLEDESKLICVLCTRRAAKSFSAAKRLLRALYKHPGSSALFVALTRESAKKILWKDTLKVLNRTHRLGAKFNETELSMTLPNGSVLYLLGVDTTEEEKQKLLGQKYAEVVIDEAASYSIDLFELVFGILKPAVADYRGTIVLTGTPGNLKKGLFFDLTGGQDPCVGGTWRKDGWSGHRWNTLENPYMVQQWTEEIAELEANNPRIRETPLFQQNYLGRWVIDDSKLVYRYVPGRNDFNGTLPSFRGGEWSFGLGVDLGFTDACSFTTVAWHPNCRTLFVLESYKRAGLDITATAQEIDAVKRRWPITTTVIDGANKQAVEELNNRHGTDAMAADKREKAEFIDIMNSEFIQQRIVLGPKCEELKAEYAGLIWDEKALEKRKRVEHPNCENHCADGTLYIWRWCYPYMATEEKPAPSRVNTEEWYKEQAAQAAAELEAEMEAQFAENRRRQAEEMEQAQWE